MSGPIKRLCKLTINIWFKGRWQRTCIRTMSSKVVNTDLDSGVLHNNEWVRRWEVKDVGFHKPVHAAILDKKEVEMFEGKTKSIFAPLCGKSLDLKWFYDKGHTVCGVEIAEQAIREFFEDHSMEYDIQEIDKVGKLYKSKDGRISLYAADLYDVKVDVVGQFDMIYDCRSLVAINLEDHQLYRDLMLSLMKKDGKYVLMTVEYDETIWPGPPHSTSDKVVRGLYGDRCNIDVLEENITNNPSVTKEEGMSDKKDDSNSVELSTERGKLASALKSSKFVATRWYMMAFM